MRVTPKRFHDLVEQAVRELPPTFAHYLTDLVIDVEPLPDRRTCRELEIDDPTELMGLYDGVPLTERSVADSGRLSDRVILYQQNIEREADNEREVIDEIRTTLLHEIGHFFGLDEDELDRLGYG